MVISVCIRLHLCWAMLEFKAESPTLTQYNLQHCGFPFSLLSNSISLQQWGKRSTHPPSIYLLAPPRRLYGDTVSESLTTSFVRNNIISLSADWCLVALVFSLQLFSQNAVFWSDFWQLLPQPPSRSVRWGHAFVTQLESSVTIHIPSRILGLLIAGFCILF